ncbi:hypothetical protein AB0P12_23760 [Streptomyces subrutilus]|uniref:WXG100 family type VII secretion target n=1 Tax=Streptomyces subrutilus TaxID=36818 RepID=UPI003447FB81
MATDFEGHTHQQLKAMSDALKPETVKARAEQLKKASEDIAKIAEKLKKHRVTGWEGESATAFQEWVGRAGNATLRLSEYSEQGSHWMTQAVQKMVEAQGMPAYDTDAAANLEAARKYHNDPDAAALGSEARSKLNSELTEAKKRMKALAEAYELSSQQMNKAEIPTFPPPPAAFVPEGYHGSEDVARSSGDASRSGGGGSGSLTPSSRQVSDSATPWTGRPPQSEEGPPPTTEHVLGPVAAEREVDVDLDHVATLPPPTTAPPTAVTPGGPLPGGPGSGPGIGPVPFPSPVARPAFAGPGTSVGGAALGTLPHPIGSGAPVMQGAKPFGALPGMPPRDPGITGGRPVAPGGLGSGIPRGTVIGSEGAHTGRGMTGGGGMGGGAGGAHGAGAGPAGARRLASEPGGVIGGRQTAGSSARFGQPFTQGGSGLVRNNAGGAGAGAMGHGGAGARTPGKRREDRGGERPDYLAEDEETWQGSRRVVPPVID